MSIRSPYPRRRFLRNAMGGFGSLAFCGILGAERQLHHFAKARSVIYLYMEGGPSQVDTFDYKPKLVEWAGRHLPFDTPATVFNSGSKVMPSPFSFRQQGHSGAWVSDLFPHLASVVDDLTIIRSLHHEVSNHSAACYKTHTGEATAGRPSMGSWITYGLGSANRDLPGFVVLDCGQAPAGGSQTWGSGFLPADFEGVKFLNGNVTVEFLDRRERDRGRQQAKLSAIAALNGQRLETIGGVDPALEAVIAGYEKAARMQTAVPELMDISGESEATKRLYGLDEPQCSVFGSRCLIARRLVERGVRFVEVFSPRVKADRWDQHGGLEAGHRNNAIAVDQPIAALIRDLKARGLLDETIVLWGGEFGRTPSSQGTNGRDHNPFGYTNWVAGGGFRPGTRYGATDEFGYYAEHDKVHLHDLHATILHQLGIDHERLTFRHAGRDFRLTDVYGRVVNEILV